MSVFERVCACVNMITIVCNHIMCGSCVRVCVCGVCESVSVCVWVCDERVNEWVNV